MTKLGKARKKVFFLDGYEGAYQSGAMYRSEIAVDVNTFEEKFDKNIVGMVIETKYNSDKPSYTIEFYTEANSEDILKREKELNEEAMRAESQADNNPDDGSWKGR